MKFVVFTNRASATVKVRINDALRESYKKDSENPMSVFEGLVEGIVEVALNVYQERVRNAFERAGFDVGEGPITLDAIKNIVAERSGIELAGWDAESIKKGVMAAVSRSVSNELGIELDLTQDIKMQVMEAAKQAVASGRPNKLVSHNMLMQLKGAAAAMKIGLTPEDRRKMLHRKAQRAYAKTHKLVWG